jgi:hypothetical protein
MAAAMTAPGSLQAGTFATYGDTFSNGTSFDLTSNASPYSYSGIQYTPDPGLTLSGLSNLSAGYNMLNGSFVGGSPRFGIQDASNHQVWVYWGTPLGGGSFTNPNPNGVWGNTGNFVGSSTVSFYSNGFGGFNSPNVGVDWATLLASVNLGTVITAIFLDLDAGWAGTDQHLLVNNFTVNQDVLTTPLPAALPLFATGLGAVGLLGWRRKKKAAALAA